MHRSKTGGLMSPSGHSRPGPARRRSSHVRYVPKATVGHQNAIGRDGPEGDKVRRGKRAYSITSSASAITGAGISRPMALAVFRFITNR